MTLTLASVKQDMQDMQVSQTKVVSLSMSGKGAYEIIAETAEKIRGKIEKDRDKKTTLLDTAILTSYDSSEDNNRIHAVINTAKKVISMNPAIGANHTTIKLIKDCLLLTNPKEYIEIKNRLLELTECESLALISDDDLEAIIIAFGGNQ